jgi:hypothetical protein
MKNKKRHLSTVSIKWGSCQVVEVVVNGSKFDSSIVLKIYSKRLIDLNCKRAITQDRVIDESIIFYIKSQCAYGQMC